MDGKTEVGRLCVSTNGMQVTGTDCNDEVIFEGGSLRDATEAIEYLVLQMQYANRVGNFNPDGSISAMQTNPDLRQKCQKVIDEAKEVATNQLPKIVEKPNRTDRKWTGD